MIVKQRCADSIDQTIDMYNVWKLHKLHQLREHGLQKEMFVHKCMNQVTRTFTYNNGKGKIHVSFICHV